MDFVCFHYDLDFVSSSSSRVVLIFVQDQDEYILHVKHFVCLSFFVRSLVFICVECESGFDVVFCVIPLFFLGIYANCKPKVFLPYLSISDPDSDFFSRLGYLFSSIWSRLCVRPVLSEV